MQVIKKDGEEGFNLIKSVWEIELWPERKSEIKSMSSMAYLGGYNMNIYEEYNPTFFLIQLDNKIIGVNSGFKTAPYLYRSRGIWIDSNYRGKSISKKLFESLKTQAIKENCTHIWSIPRQSAWPAYKAFGFEQTSDWFNEGMEFGPNCYVLKEIKILTIDVNCC